MSVTPQRTRDDSTTKNHGCSKNKEGRDVSFARGDPKSKTVVPQYRALILRENESIFPLFSQKKQIHRYDYAYVVSKPIWSILSTLSFRIDMDSLWYLDSDASTHMTNDSGTSNKVVVGNSALVLIIAADNSIVHTPYGLP